MNLMFWTVVVPVIIVVSLILDYSQGWKRGPPAVQGMGRTLFGSLKRASFIYVTLTTLVFWLAESYLSLGHVGLGVGIAAGVTVQQLVVPTAEWIFLVVFTIVVLGGRFRHPAFLWVFPPYPKQISRAWVIRARLWNRSENKFRSFLLKYKGRFQEKDGHFYREAIEDLATREDWIGKTAMEVLAN